MFGLLKTAPCSDPALGTLHWSKGHWRGTITLAGSATPLAVSGNRRGPDPEALQIARSLTGQLPAWRPAIEAALFDHYQPYAEASANAASGRPAPMPPACPRIEAPHEVWPHVALVFVSVAPLGGTLTAELGYTTAWDEEHTLGARFQAGRLVELCGSVLSA